MKNIWIHFRFSWNFYARSAVKHSSSAMFKGCGLLSFNIQKITKEKYEKKGENRKKEN